MPDADLQNPIFTDENAAREALEACRWPNGPVCPHCGTFDRIALIGGEKRSHRPGLYYCNGCKGQFTVTVGSVFERSKVPLTKWWLAAFMLGASKKGMSTHQLHRMLGVTYKTAWFMTMRIREAMREGHLPGGVGGEGKFVECALIGFDKLSDSVEVHPLKMGGVPVVRDTRFTVSQALAELARSSGVAEVADNYDLDPSSLKEMLDGLSLLLMRPLPR